MTRRWTRATWALAIASLLVACGGSKQKPAEGAESESSTEGEQKSPDEGSSGEAKPTEGAGAPASKASLCTGSNIDLMAALNQASCEVKNPPSDAKPRDMKGLLEVKVIGPDKVTPGGHADFTVTFFNKSKGPLPLDFVLDPTPRFSVEAYDKKGNRADMPHGDPPGRPADAPGPSPNPPGIGRVTIDPGGAAFVKVGWDANRTKWAPDKVKGTPAEMGYPRSPAGPLPKGKYEVHVVTPLTGAFEGSDHEVSAPRAPIEVAK